MEEKTTLLIPAHDETENIEKVLQVALKAQKAGVLHEVVVINDGSTDKTAEKARKMGVKVLTLKENQGKTMALLFGFRHCRRNGSRIIVTLDADLTNPTVSRIKQLIEPLKKDPALRMVVGTVVGDAVGVSGERALRTELLDFLFKGEGIKIKGISGRIPVGPKKYKEMLLASPYAIEATLNYLATREHLLYTLLSKFKGVTLRRGKCLFVTTNFTALPRERKSREASKGPEKVASIIDRRKARAGVIRLDRRYERSPFLQMMKPPWGYEPRQKKHGTKHRK